MDSRPLCDATLPESSGVVADGQAAAEPRSAVSVLLIAPRFSTKGGIQSYCQTLIPNLQQSVEVFFVGPESEQEGRISRSARVVFDLVRLFLRYRKKDIDVVHINTSLQGKPVIREGAALLLAKLCSIKTLVFFHGWSVGFEAIIRKRFAGLFKRVFNKADLIIVLAKDFQRSLAEFGITTRIAIERTFYCDELLRDVSEETVRSRMADRGRPFTTLFLSRIVREKGIYTVLDAHALLKQFCPDARLLVAGDGKELDNVRRYTEANHIEDVTFLGYVADAAKRNAFMESDVLILPTTYGEGLPISIVEGMRCGLSVVTRPVGGIKDVFQDEVMGWLISGSEASDYFDVLKKLCGAPERRLQIGLYNQAYAIRYFSSGAAGERMNNYYATICAA